MFKPKTEQIKKTQERLCPFCGDDEQVGETLFTDGFVQSEVIYKCYGCKQLYRDHQGEEAYRKKHA